MRTDRNHITVFEHQSIRLNQLVEGPGEPVEFDQSKLEAMQRFYGTKGVPYFSLIHNGIRFKKYVGVIQVGNLLIEVLPKADAVLVEGDEKVKWRNILIGMLQAVGIFKIHAPSSSSLKVKSNSILDLYFELFVKEVEYLLRQGLVKKYRKKEGNVTALKGSLQFGKHLQQNLTHQERFYVRHNTYDLTHQLHFIIYKTIRLLKRVNTNASLHSRIGALLLHFPEMPDIKVTEATFEKLVFNRKTEAYRTAIDVAKLLLLQYHPDVSKGRNNVLALMFDMNRLWEKFVYVSLRKNKKHNTKITAQSSKLFWKPTKGYSSTMRPDIVIQTETGSVVLDTKWKNLKGYNPSPDDLRQMYVYGQYYGADRVALVYPGVKFSEGGGVYANPETGELDGGECSVICLGVDGMVKEWQRKIYKEIEKWVG